MTSLNCKFISHISLSMHCGLTYQKICHFAYLASSIIKTAILLIFNNKTHLSITAIEIKSSISCCNVALAVSSCLSGLNEPLSAL